MNRTDDQFERWVVRSVHGELSDEDALELDRALIRDPQLRRFHEDIADVDRLSGEALGALFATPRDANPIRRPLIPTAARGRRWFAHVERWFLPAAVAAAILVAFIFPGHRRSEPIAGKPTAPSHDRIPLIGDDPGTVMGTPVSTMPTNVKRNTARNVIGVIDRNGKIWILELDRTQTLRIPGTTETYTPPDGL